MHEKNRLFFLVIPPPLSIDEKLKKQEKTILFDKNDFDGLKNLVDGFSLMTYDYSSHNTIIGPNAPLKWVYDNVQYYIDGEPSEIRAKMLLGLNFYGTTYQMDYNGKLQKQPEPIVGHSFIDMLKKSKGSMMEFRYDEKSGEHIILIKESDFQTLVFYPSLYSIQKRLDLAADLGTGISNFISLNSLIWKLKIKFTKLMKLGIWELGQGLDYFYDLL